MADQPPLDTGPIDTPSVETASIIDSESGSEYDTSVLGDIGSGGGGTTEPSDSRAIYAVDHMESDGDLATGVLNALNALPGGAGTVWVGSPPNGDEWTWASELTLDLVERVGASIEVAFDVPIDIQVNQDQWAIVLDNTPSVSGGHPGAKSKLSMHGGYWTMGNSTDPAGWMRIKDSIGVDLHPALVTDVTNSADDATGVSIENWASYSESTHIGGFFDRVDRGVDFVPRSDTGGSGGSDSFHDTYIENLHVNGFDFCLRLRGAFDFSQVTKPALFGKADGATCLIVDIKRFDGTSISGIKTESPGNFSNVTGVKVLGDTFYPPTNMGRFDGFGIDTAVDTSEASFDFWGQYRNRELSNEFLNWSGGDMRVNRSGGIEADGGIDAGGNLTLGGYQWKIRSPNIFHNDQDGNYLKTDSRDGGLFHAKYPLKFPSGDVSSRGSVGNNVVYVHHDGSDGNPAGLYYSDTENSQWVAVWDSSITIGF